MTKRDIWERYKKKNPRAESYSAWSFCGGGKGADELADLVILGIKTATSSAFQIYQIENSPIPSMGDLSVILKANGDAVCIIRTTDVAVCRFCDVTPEHAYNEGEDSRSLEDWRKVHKHFFTRELEEHDLPFDENMLVVCETFELEFM
jgi:uncharacterized protein YhfF